MSILKSNRISDKFHQSYQIDPITQCWNYTLLKNGKPRAICFNNNVRTPANYSYQYKYGAFPDIIKNGVIVKTVHWVIFKRCSNPLCVNPDHLYLSGNVSPKITKKIPLFVYQIIKDSDLSVVELSKLVGYDPRVIFKIKDGSLPIV